MPEIPTLLLIMFGIVAFLLIGNVWASFEINRRQNSGRTLAEIQHEFEIRKSVFAIVGGVSILFGAAFSFYEFALKVRAEDRQTLYGALGQLIAVDDKRPEISAAALLQLERLGATSEDERPALLQIVTAYLNERAKFPVKDHNASRTARPDIQMAVYVLSRLIGNDPKLGELVFLKEVDLRHVRIDNVSLPGVRMIGVDFQKARLDRASFAGSDLTGSKFKNAFLQRATFGHANLDFVTFEGANVSHADFCAVRSRRGVRLENLAGSDAAKCLK